MKSPLAPSLILAGILALCLLNGAWLTRRCNDWAEQLDDIDARCLAQDWNEAEAQLETLYVHWQSIQPWLHVILDHDEINAAEALFCRAMVLVEEEDSVEFRSHIADLRSQLILLAELEQLRPENVL